MAKQSATSAIKLKGAERRIDVLNARKTGATYNEIATQFEISPTRAYQMVREELEKLTAERTELREEVMQIEMERLDGLFSKAWEKAMAGDLRAIDACLKVMDRRAKMLGIDAPIKVAPTDVSGENPYLLLPDSQLAEVAKCIARAAEIASKSGVSDTETS